MYLSLYGDIGAFMAINKIMCCCGVGLGSSFLIEMNVQKALKKFGLQDIEVEHTTISDAFPGAADLFIIGADLADQIRNIGDTVILKNIISQDELESKLEEYFKSKGII